MQKNTSLGSTKVLPRFGTALTRLFTVKGKLFICLNDMHSPNVHFSIALHKLKRPCFRKANKRLSSIRAERSPTSVPQRWDTNTASTQSVVYFLRLFIGTFKPVEEQLFPVSKLLQYFLFKRSFQTSMLHATNNPFYFQLKLKVLLV
jgi:hypothetical protein